MAAKKPAKKSAKRPAKKPAKKSAKAARRSPARTPERQSRVRAGLPYTTRPNALRRFLAEVPRRPRPPRVNEDLLSSWGMGGGENGTIIRVLRTLSLVDSNNVPTEHYAAFMRAGVGPSVLGARIRELYAPLFAASLEPQREPAESLRNLFNIHSSGAPGTIDYQIQTFRALCDNAVFDNALVPSAEASVSGAGVTQAGAIPSSALTSEGSLGIHIDLHIHLPENRTSREYQYIIQDIAHFIYGQEQDAAREPEGRS
jgi:hypothetical protein